MKNKKLEDYPVGKRPEYVVDWLYRFNLYSEYGTPIPTSIAKKAIQDIQKTRWERSLFMILFLVSFIGWATLVCFI